MNRNPRLDRQQAIVLVVDVQERLAPAMANLAGLEKRCRTLVLGARALGVPVVASEQYPKGLGPTIPSLREALPEPPLSKMAFSCLAEESFAQAFEKRGRRQVILAGIEAHVCVWQTARDLVDRGYEVFVCADAVTSRAEEHKEIALSALRHLGAFVTSTETVLFDLLGRAGTDEFKRVSALVK